MTTNRIRVPGDKSISHRALIIAALADGESRVRDILQSQDIESTAGVLRSYGVHIPPLAPDLVIRGVGLKGFRAPSGPLDCGNSGTTARLMMGIAAALPFASKFVGDASLSKRPMRRLASVLERMGGSFEFEVSDGLPFVVTGGKLGDLEYVNSSASAQIKSALLLAGLVSSANVRVVEPRRSRDHTERMLASAGARIRSEGGEVSLSPTRGISPIDFAVPSDPSSAAYFAAYAALRAGGDVLLENVCLNPTRTGFFKVLRAMGAAIDERRSAADAAGEEVGSISVTGGKLAGTTLSEADVPSTLDELPLLGCVAAAADGDTVVRGAGELRVKESDRIMAIVQNLRSVGADAEELTDGFVVRGSRKALRGTVRTFSDHRIAMAFGVLGALPGNVIEVDDMRCVAVSYPGFWEDLRRISAFTQ